MLNFISKLTDKSQHYFCQWYTYPVLVLPLWSLQGRRNLRSIYLFLVSNWNTGCKDGRDASIQSEGNPK